MALAIELSAVVVAIRDGEALVLCRNLTGKDPRYALPSGPFAPDSQRTFDLALRAFVREQTGFDIGYVEQLYSFGDEGRETLNSPLHGQGTRIISIGYLALTPLDFTARFDSAWVPFRRFFPWEDRRGTGPATDPLRTALDAWAGGDGLRQRRVETLFPADIDLWNEERVLDRYELLYDAGLIGEAGSAGGAGEAMASDHRRIAATALSRLRGKVKYRPVIFELMPDSFTLLELQKSLEGLCGLRLHKQNFRRALDRTGFVQPTGRMRDDTGGRPAELYRHDRDLFRLGPASGLSLPRA